MSEETNTTVGSMRLGTLIEGLECKPLCALKAWLVDD